MSKYAYWDKDGNLVKRYSQAKKWLMANHRNVAYQSFHDGTLPEFITGKLKNNWIYFCNEHGDMCGRIKNQEINIYSQREVSFSQWQVESGDFD